MNAWDANAQIGARVIVRNEHSVANGTSGTIVKLGPRPLGTRPAWALVDLDRCPEWSPRRYWLYELEMEAEQ